MRGLGVGLGLLLALAVPSWPTPASAQETFATTPIALARELLLRARRLDDGATNDEKAAAALAAELPAKRAAAKVARDIADRATGDAKAAAEARAEDLETDVIITEVEIGARRTEAAEDRRSAKELRARAVRLVQGNSAELSRMRARQSDIF